MRQAVIQKAEERQRRQQPNLTGIPTQMKMDFEQRSGLSFDDVRVHYNSDKPRKIGALAYTQGTQVHIGPGQERHLRHELGHVVQQKMGIVQATHRKQGLAINRSLVLEHWADLGYIPSSTGSATEQVVQCDTDDSDYESLEVSVERRFGETSEFEVSREKGMLFWRGDRREPSEVFRTGFTTAQERDSGHARINNVIVFRRGGDYDDIASETAVCVSDNIVGASFFPLEGDTSIYIYAIELAQYFDTYALQQELDKARRRKLYRKKTVPDDWRIDEDFGYTNQESNVWQFREYAAHRIEPKQIIGAWEVEREFISSDTAEEPQLGIQFYIKSKFIKNHSYKGKNKKLADRAKKEAEFYQALYPGFDVSVGKETFISYSGIVDRAGKSVRHFPPLTLSETVTDESTMRPSREETRQKRKKTKYDAKYIITPSHRVSREPWKKPRKQTTTPKRTF